MCDLNAATSSQTKYATWLHLILYFLLTNMSKNITKEKPPSLVMVRGFLKYIFYFLYPCVVFTTEPSDNTRGYQQLLNCDFTLIICCLIVLIVILYYNYYKDTKSSSKVKLFFYCLIIYFLTHTHFTLVPGPFHFVIR